VGIKRVKTRRYDLLARKHDGHRLIAILPGDGQLLGRYGYDRTKVFREPFWPLIDAKLQPMVLDGEIAVPDDRGVTQKACPAGGALVPASAYRGNFWSRRNEAGGR